MNDLTFLDEELANKYDASNATLKVVLPGGKVIHISDNISPVKFLDACPLLYHSFEYNSQSQLQASIEASSEAAIISLARYCYTGSYLASEPDGDSILLLQHAETYKIAEDFDVPELQIMAHGNFSCQIEYACCLPKPPRDLLDTIRFIYRYFASDEARRKHNLVDTLLNYCVAVYLYHKLGESLDFLTAVHEISAFRQDLCRTNIARNFEDDCAAEIIRLPSGSIASSSRAPTTLSSRDLPSEMLYDLPRNITSANSAPANSAPADSAPAEASNHTATLSLHQKILSTKACCREIPDQSKHSISPSALTAALEKYKESFTPDIESEAASKGTTHKYKRARIDKATARLPGRPFLPESASSSTYFGKKERRATVKVESATTSDEESYWQGTFGQSEMRFSKVSTVNTSMNARRLLFEYGRCGVQPEHKATSSPPKAKVDTTAAVVLPHRLHDPGSASEANPLADTISEDEDFALVRRPQASAGATSHSPMSSPELVPMVSLDQIGADDKNISDDGWFLL